MAKIAVAPLVGARIEIQNNHIYPCTCIVAPLVGARIEIIVNLDFMDFYIVAPLVGARIEMHKYLFRFLP